jgi:hypothetical protein
MKRGRQLAMQAPSISLGRQRMLLSTGGISSEMTQLRRTGECDCRRSCENHLLHGDGSTQDIGACRNIIYTQPDRPGKENLS